VEPQQSCEKAIKLGSAENVLTNCSTLNEPGSELLPTLVTELDKVDVSKICHKH